MDESPRAAALRTDLIDQVGYLIEEAEALKAVIGLVPEVVLTARGPEGEGSIKELFGALAERDARAYRPHLRARLAMAPEAEATAAARGDAPSDADWNAWAVEDILAHVQAERRRLLALLHAVAASAWPGEPGADPQGMYAFVHGITQHDAAVLQQVSLLLHERRPAPR